MCRCSTGRNFLKFWCQHFVCQKNQLKFTPVVRGGRVSSTTLVFGASRSLLIISFFPLKYIRAKFSRHVVSLFAILQIIRKICFCW